MPTDDGDAEPTAPTDKLMLSGSKLTGSGTSTIAFAVDGAA